MCVIASNMKSSKINQILIVEDDETVRMHLKIILSPFGRIFLSSSKDEALRAIQNTKLTHAFVDLDLDKNLEGYEIIEKCIELGIRCAALTCHENETIIKKCIELGVDFYYDKINFFENKEKIIENFLGDHNFEQSKLESFFTYKYITTDNGLRENIKFVLSKGISEERVILLLGPTGTGKTTLAKLLHEESGKQGRFINFNANSCPKHLIESRLFGHKKGSFTGAEKDEKGLFELADNGTLFLDEIGDVSYDMQVKLLKAIEDREFWPLGSDKPVKSSFRLICAGNNILEKMTEGIFREDLFFRINDFPITIRPLSQRRDDIAIQAKHFANCYSKKQGRGHISFTAEAILLLRKYEWKGNSRELENEIKKIIDFSDRPLIDSTDLPNKFHIHETNSSDVFLSKEQIDILENDGLSKLVQAVQRAAIEKYVVNNGNNKYQGRKILKLSKSSISRLMEQFNKHMDGLCH